MKTSHLLLVLFVMWLSSASFSRAQSVITGTVIGSDGRAMPKANVEIVSPLERDNPEPYLRAAVLTSVRAEADGRFTITTGLTGPYLIAFFGVDHQPIKVPIVLTGHDSLSLTAKLEQTQYLSGFGPVAVAYDMDEVVRGRQVKMKLQPDGKYNVRIPTSRPEIVYDLLGIDRSSGTATSAATAVRFEFQRRDGRYFAVARAGNGYANITFDPYRLARSAGSADVEFADTNLVQAKFVQYYEKLRGLKKKHDESLEQHFASGGTYASFRFDPDSALRALMNEVGSVDAPLLKQELSLEYLETAELSTAGFDTPEFRALVSSVPSNSPAWAYHGTLPLEVSSALQDSASFVNGIIANPPSKEFAALLLFRLCTYAEHDRNHALAEELRSQLVSRFHDTVPGKAAEIIMARPPVAGSTINFSFASVDDTTFLYSSRDLRGKYVLLDFWATWCGGCVAGMKYLKQAYDEYRKSGLEILSVSFDNSRKYVRVFEKTKFRMPWKSAYVPVEEQEKTQKDLKFNQFPTMVLLNPEGKIVESGSALEGEKLLRTLSKYLVASR